MADDIFINRPVAQRKWDACRRLTPRWAAYKDRRTMPIQDVVDKALELGLAEMRRQLEDYAP